MADLKSVPKEGPAVLLILLQDSLGAGSALAPGLPCEAHLGEAAQLAPHHVGDWPQGQGRMVHSLPWHCCCCMYPVRML